MQTSNFTHNKTKTTITFDGKVVKYSYFDEDGFEYNYAINEHNVPNGVGGLSNFHRMICDANRTRTETNMIISNVNAQHTKISFVCKYCEELAFDFDIIVTFVNVVINYGDLNDCMRKLFPCSKFGGNLTYVCKMNIDKYFACFEQIDKRFTFAFLHKVFQTKVGTYFNSEVAGEYASFYTSPTERKVVLNALLDGLQKLIDEKNPLLTLDEICKKYE